MNKTKAMCVGCHNDYYNHSEKNGCWMFEKASIVTMTSVGTWQEPPYKWNPQETLSCHRQVGRSWIDKDDPRIKEAIDRDDPRNHER